MSLEIRVDLREVKKFAENLNGKGFEIARQEISRTMTTSVAVLDQAIRPRIPEGATGILRGSAGTEIRGNPLSTLTGEFTVAAAYGLPAERGRKPGRMPPLGPIELWVQRKLSLTGKEAKQVAFLIARAIGARGTKPGQRFVAEGFDVVAGRITAYWDALPDRLVLRWSKEL